MKTITTICKECGKKFEKSVSEYNRSEQKGMKHFCNNTCSAIYVNTHMSMENRKKCGDKIKIHAGNRQDNYSGFKYFINKSKVRTQYEIPDIDVEYLKKLWDTQRGICPYTNLEMTLPKNTLEYHSKRSRCPKRASLDRIDSSRGYIKGNVEFVCYAINLAKNSFTREEMKEFLSEIGGRGENRIPVSDSFNL